MEAPDTPRPKENPHRMSSNKGGGGANKVSACNRAELFPPLSLPLAESGDSCGGRNVPLPPVHRVCIADPLTDPWTSSRCRYTAKLGQTHTQALSLFSQGFLHTLPFPSMKLHYSQTYGHPARPTPGSLCSRGQARLSDAPPTSVLSPLVATVSRALSRTLLYSSDHWPIT